MDRKVVYWEQTGFLNYFCKESFCLNKLINYWKGCKTICCGVGGGVLSAVGWGVGEGIRQLSSSISKQLSPRSQPFKTWSF